MANQNATPTAKEKNAIQKTIGMPKCPHCNKNINVVYAWSLKSKGEYQCKSCGGYSNIKIGKYLYFAGLAAVILAAIMLLIFILTSCNLVALLPCMLIPFLIFTAMSPFFLQFEKIFPEEARKKKKPASVKTATAFSLEQKDREKK